MKEITCDDKNVDYEWLYFKPNLELKTTTKIHKNAYTYSTYLRDLFSQTSTHFKI